MDIEKIVGVGLGGFIVVFLGLNCFDYFEAGNFACAAAFALMLFVAIALIGYVVFIMKRDGDDIDVNKDDDDE